MTRATRRCTTPPWGEAWVGARWGRGSPQVSGHHAPAAPSPVRNQPEAARLLLSSGCGANALNGTRSAALHVAVQRGFLEVVRVLCERGCDVNLPVSAGSAGPGLKDAVVLTFLPSDHWPPAGRMPTPTRLCTVPSRRALAPAASWRSSPRCRASTSLPLTARASPCCTTRPSRATRCELGGGAQPAEPTPVVLPGHCGHSPDPRHISPLPRAVRRILARARQLVDAKKEDGFTALHLAALNNHREVAQILIREVWTRGPGPARGPGGQAPAGVPGLSRCPPPLPLLRAAVT